MEAAERWPEAPDSAPLPDGMRVNIYETSALLEVPIVEEYGDRSADRWLNADELRAIAERLNWAADRLDQR